MPSDSDGLGWGGAAPANSSFQPVPSASAVLPLTLVPSTGVFQSQPGQAPPTEPPIPTVHLRLSEPPPLTDAQKQAILANLVTYQQHGYPLAQWNALNPDDQALLAQAGIQPQAAPPPAPASNAGEIVVLVTVVGLAGVAAWYFWSRK